MNYKNMTISSKPQNFKKKKETNTNNTKIPSNLKNWFLVKS